MFISNVTVKLIRIIWAGTTQPVTHNTGVTVGITGDPAAGIYLRIAVNQKVYVLLSKNSLLSFNLFSFNFFPQMNKSLLFKLFLDDFL
jgi:hypothetical protein